MPYDFGKIKQVRQDVKAKQEEDPKRQAMKRRLTMYSSKKVTPKKG